MARKPLAGRTVLVTRPERPSGALSAGLRALGARVLRAPVIRFAAPRSFTRLDSALRRMAEYDIAVFASPRAVESVFARARALGLKPAAPPRVLAVGPATARALRRRGWPALTARRHRAEGLAAAAGRVRGRRVFLPRAEQGRADLPRLLRARGARVDAVTAYRTLADRRAARRLRAAAGRVDAVLFASGSAVESLLDQLSADSRRRLFARAAAAAIGPVTGAALARRGIKAAVTARRATPSALCAAVSRHFDGR
jgi:uroporphyrinogen III methyltransferase/synthase